MRSLARGEAIFRTNSFTEYKGSGLSMARKLNRAATLWNSFSSPPVRRSSSSLISSGEPSGREKHAVGLGRAQLPTVAMSMFYCLSGIVTTRGPKLRLCSARMHLAADSVYAFAPRVGTQ